MKKLLCLFFLLISAWGICQTTNQKVEQQFSEYSQLIIGRNIDKALDYAHPEMFKIVPRDQMKSLMEQVYNMKGIEYKTSMPTLSDFEEVKIINNKSFVRFKSHTTIEMKFTPVSNDKPKTVEELSATKKQRFAAFENKFGKGNVEFDDTSGFYKLKTVKTVIAMSDAQMKDWKFAIVDNPKMKAMLENFIPAELLKN